MDGQGDPPPVPGGSPGSGQPPVQGGGGGQQEHLLPLRLLQDRWLSREVCPGGGVQRLRDPHTEGLHHHWTVCRVPRLALHVRDDRPHRCQEEAEEGRQAEGAVPQHAAAHRPWI